MSLSLTVASHNSISLRKKEVLGFTLIFISARIDDFTDWKIEKITTQSKKDWNVFFYSECTIYNKRF